MTTLNLSYWTSLWHPKIWQIIFYEVKGAQLCLTLCNPMDYSPLNSLGQNTGVGNLFLLQGIFPTQGSNSDLPHCRQIHYRLSHQGNPRIQESIAFSSRSSQPRNQTGVSCIGGIFFTSLPTREACVSIH